MHSVIERPMFFNSVKNTEFLNYSDDSKAGTMNNYLGMLSPAASSLDSTDMNSPLSSSMSPTQLLYSQSLDQNITLYDDGTVTATAMDSMPYMKIIEQPTEKFRFRYKSEMVGTHGSLTGANSDRIRKSTYPTVRLHNYEGRAVIRCALYQINNLEPHAHRLVVRAGNGEKDDPHDLEVGPERGFDACFQGMGIIHTAKKHLAGELVKKKIRLYREELHRQGHFRDLNTKEETEIKQSAEIESKSMNLNTVRLGFEAFHVNSRGVHIPICSPVYSHGINNLKSALTGELKIVRMDRTTASCQGGQEIFILVEKVTKNNIKVRFFEIDEDDNEVWSDYGRFSHIDVHHQYAIVLKAPRYKDLNIENTVEVFIELVRPTDGARSEPRQFKYKPCEKLGRKRTRYSESSYSSSELPATINNISFGSSSISVSDSILKDPDFFKNMENVNSDQFNSFLLEYLPEYQNAVTGEISQNDLNSGIGNLTTDGPGPSLSPPRLAINRDSETEMHAKKVCSELTQLLKSSPEASRVEDLVKNLFIKFRTRDGNTALHSAIICEQYEHLQYILVLLSKMKHLKILDIKNDSGETALHIAMKINNPTVVNLLLSVGIDPNLVDYKSNTALHYAVLNNKDLSEYKSLLKATNLNLENDAGYTPLHIAVSKNNLSAVKLLIESNADVNHKHPSNGNTALHMAIEEKNSEIVTFLIEKTHARLDVENYMKRTPIHMAKLLADSEGSAAEKVFSIIKIYINENGFESLLVKIEPEDDESTSASESDMVIKSEPASPERMDVDSMNTEYENDENFESEFSGPSIRLLGQVLDNTEILERLSKTLDFDSISTSLTKISTKMLLNYANVTGISVVSVRRLLQAYGASEAVNIIDKILKKKNDVP